MFLKKRRKGERCQAGGPPDNSFPKRGEKERGRGYPNRPEKSSPNRSPRSKQTRGRRKEGLSARLLRSAEQGGRPEKPLKSRKKIHPAPQGIRLNRYQQGALGKKEVRQSKRKTVRQKRGGGKGPPTPTRTRAGNAMMRRQGQTESLFVRSNYSPAEQTDRPKKAGQRR